jgi:hypothetical protein
MGNVQNSTSIIILIICHLSKERIKKLLWMRKENFSTWILHEKLSLLYYWRNHIVFCAQVSILKHKCIVRKNLRISGYNSGREMVGEDMVFRPCTSEIKRFNKPAALHFWTSTVVSHFSEPLRLPYASKKPYAYHIPPLIYEIQNECSFTILQSSTYSRSYKSLTS